MAYIQKELRGSLFKNDKKTEDMHPSAKGKCLIDGVSYYMDAWTKEGTNGKWQSISFKRVDAAPVAKQVVKESAKVSTPDKFEDDDIPF